MQIRQADIKNGVVPDGVHRIEPGLYLRVKGPYQNFYLRIQVGGERKDVSIGSARVITLAMARKRAEDIRIKLKTGQPLKSAPKPEADVRLFEDVFAETIEITREQRRWKSETTYEQWTYMLRGPVLDRLKGRDITTVGVDDIAAVLRPIWTTSTPTAIKVRNRLERCFDYATFKGWYSKPNPARWRGNLDMILPQSSKVHEEVHHEAMTLDETRRVAAALCPDRISHALTLFGLLVVARVSEYRLATWDEVDLDAAVLTVPRARSKVDAGEDFRIPLSRQAVELLRRLPHRDGIIFPSDYGERAGKVFSINTPRTIIKRILGRHITMHGIRSTFADWAEGRGIREALYEKSLSHATGNKVHRAYQRSDLLEERREVMQAWADEILGDKEM